MTFVRYFPTARIPRPYRDAESYAGAESSVTWRPRTDVIERDDAYELLVELPGLSRDDVSISFKNDSLTISGNAERDEQEGEHYYRRERNTGAFSRAFRVPEHSVDSESISASFADGLLALRLPKAAEVLPTQIEITD